jgi:hypothetical protein
MMLPLLVTVTLPEVAFKKADAKPDAAEMPVAALSVPVLLTVTSPLLPSFELPDNAPIAALVAVMLPLLVTVTPLVLPAAAS